MKCYVLECHPKGHLERNMAGIDQRRLSCIDLVDAALCALVAQRLACLLLSRRGRIAVAQQWLSVALRLLWRKTWRPLLCLPRVRGRRPGRPDLSRRGRIASRTQSADVFTGTDHRIHRRHRASRRRLAVGRSDRNRGERRRRRKGYTQSSRRTQRKQPLSASSSRQARKGRGASRWQLAVGVLDRVESSEG